MKPQHIRLIALIALFVLGAWIQGRVLPPLEGGDEWLQLAYIEHLRTTGTLPNRDSSLISPIRQQSGQPPLTYAVFALPLRLANLPSIDTGQLYDQLQHGSNNWFSPPNRFNRTDNNNVFYRSAEPLNDAATVQLVRAARWIAPLWGVVGILATYAAAWEIFGDARRSLVAAALFAFTPTLTHVSSFITTDAAAAGLAAVALWLGLRAVKRGTTLRLAAAAGLVLGLAGLAKVSAVLVAPAVGVGLILGVFTPNPSPINSGRQSEILKQQQVSSPSMGFRGGVNAIIGYGIAAALPFLLTFGMWVVWGWLTYGDPFGTGTHRFDGQYFDPPLGIMAVAARLPEVYLSYWGKFASAVYLHPVTYAALSIIPISAVLGGIYQMASMSRRRNPLPPYNVGAWGVLWVAGVVTFAGLWYWLATINFITGRLAFPALAALCVLMVGGIAHLTPRHQRGDLGVGWAFVITIPAVVALVIAPLAIHAAYRVPLPAGGDVPLNETVFDFDGVIRLEGWHAQTDTIRDGELYTVTLCWQVLDRPTRPAAYALRVVRNGVPIGERVTVHGLGRYDWQQWEPGYRFCDDVDIPISGVEAGVQYDLLLFMLNAQTGAADWTATTADGGAVPFPILGQVEGIP